MVALYIQQRERKDRIFPSLPIQERLNRWLRVVAQKTAFMGRPLSLELRRKHADELGLSDQWVVLHDDGSLVHLDRETPVAILDS